MFFSHSLVTRGRILFENSISSLSMSGHGSEQTISICISHICQGKNHEKKIMLFYYIILPSCKEKLDSQKTSINKLGINRSIAKRITQDSLNPRFDQESLRGPKSSFAYAQSKSGNGAPKHPPFPLPNPVASITPTVFFASTSAIIGDCFCVPLDSLPHAVLFEAALEWFHPRCFILAGRCRVAVDLLECFRVARFPLFEITPQEEQFLPQGI